MLNKMLEMLRTLCDGLEWNIENHPTAMNESDQEALTAGRALIAKAESAPYDLPSLIDAHDDAHDDARALLAERDAEIEGLHKTIAGLLETQNDMFLRLAEYQSVNTRLHARVAHYEAEAAALDTLHNQAVDERDELLIRLADLERCLSAANKQYDRLERIARRACDELGDIVDNHYAIHEPPPTAVEEAYDKLYAELNPPESEPPTNDAEDRYNRGF